MSYPSILAKITLSDGERRATWVRHAYLTEATNPDSVLWRSTHEYGYEAGEHPSEAEARAAMAQQLRAWADTIEKTPLRAADR